LFGAATTAAALPYAPPSAPLAHTSHHGKRSPAPPHLKAGYTAKQDICCAVPAGFRLKHL